MESTSSEAFLPSHKEQLDEFSADEESGVAANVSWAPVYLVVIDRRGEEVA